LIHIIFFALAKKYGMAAHTFLLSQETGFMLTFLRAAHGLVLVAFFSTWGLQRIVGDSPSLYWHFGMGVFWSGVYKSAIYDLGTLVGGGTHVSGKTWGAMCRELQRGWFRDGSNPQRRLGGQLTRSWRRSVFLSMLVEMAFVDSTNLLGGISWSWEISV
jgi:hypothetical protein